MECPSECVTHCFEVENQHGAVLFQEHSDDQELHMCYYFDEEEEEEKEALALSQFLFAECERKEANGRRRQR